MNNHYKNLKFSTGFTLIEVLITMLILAVGVLGVAALQFKALKYNHDALMRNQISFLAQDIADLAQTEQNLSNRSNYAFPTDTVGVPNPCGNTFVQRTGCGGAINTGCDYTVHTPTNNLSCWINLARSYLPPGSQITISEENDPAGGKLYYTTFSWPDREGQNHYASYVFK